jgi:DNA-binding NtrC family response regulator
VREVEKLSQNVQPGRILIADDEPNIRRVLQATFQREGYDVLTAESGRKALDLLRANDGTDVLISDLIMPDINGVELLEIVREMNPALSVVMITAHGTIKTAVDAMRLGAFDYVTKPFDMDELKVLVRKAIERRGMLTEDSAVKTKLRKTYRFDSIIGQSQGLRQILDVVSRVARSRASVLIRGESGTGKELIARALHFNSPRAKENFVAVACIALSENLLESELFGHEKGAFTGALSQKAGRFEQANKGTLFLDEIGDIPANVQMKLLRVLQEREFERVGGNKTIKVDVRLVTATNQDLEKLVARGDFREDLFYRLKVVEIVLPPLRERREDIPLLVEHFLKRYGREDGRDLSSASAECLALLTGYSWPGNIRELENAIERACVLADPDQKELTPDLLPREVASQSA